MDITNEFYQNYQYRVLVIDDAPINDLKNNFNYIKSEIYKSKQINVNFSFISEIKNTINEIFSSPFDIIMFDENLDDLCVQLEGNHALSGRELVNKLRNKNKMCKIIFYSAELTYEEDTGNYSLFLAPDLYEYETAGMDVDEATIRAMSDQVFFDLINKYKVNKILPKDIDMIVDSIIDCCEDTDTLVMMIYRSIFETQETSFVTEYEVAGKQYSPQELLDEILKDSNVSKEFISSMFEFFSAQFMTVRRK